MAARLAVEDRQHQPTKRPAPQQQALPASTQQQGAQVVELATIRALHPDLIDM